MKHKVTPIDTNATAFYDEGTVLSILPEVIDGVLPLIHPNVDLNMRYSCIVDGNALCYLFNVNNITKTGTLALKNKYKRAKDMLHEFETDEEQKVVCDFYYNLYLNLREYRNNIDGFLGVCNVLFCLQYIFVKRLKDNINNSFAPFYSILLKLKVMKIIEANHSD